MIVQCERCGTKYKLDDSKIRDEGIKLRCSKCQHVFTVSPPVSFDEKELFGEKQEKADGPSMMEWEDEFTTKPPPEKIPTTRPTPQEPPAPKAVVPPPPEEKVFGEARADEEPAGEERTSLEEEVFPFRTTAPEKTLPKRDRKLPVILILSILLMVVIFGAFYFWTQREARIPLVESIYEKVSHLMGGKRDHKLFLIYLRGYEQKLDGEKVYVIQGRVANRSKETKKYVKLKGLLFNKEGKTLASSTGYCGLAITSKEIRETAYASLKSSFGFISPAKAPPVPSQQSLPFTIIFFSPPGGATEFRVEIAEAVPLT